MKKRRLFVNVDEDVYSQAEEAIAEKKDIDGAEITMTQFVTMAMRQLSRKILSGADSRGTRE